MPISPSFDQSAALAPVVGEFNRGNDRATALRLDEIARSRRLQDVADERAYQDTRTAKQEQRVIDRERRQKIIALASQGIELPENATDADIAKASLNQRKKRAELVIGSHESDLAAVDSEYNTTFEKIKSIVSEKATVLEKIEAAQAMLRDSAASEWLKSKEVSDINDAINNGKDPEKLIAAAAKRAGSTGVFSDHPERGDAILSAFYTPLSQSSSLSKSVQIQSLTKKLDDISDEKKIIQRSLSQSYRDNAEFLDASTLKRGQKLGAVPVVGESFGPPNPDVLPDPNDVMSGSKLKFGAGTITPGPDKVADVVAVPKGYEGYADILNPVNQSGRTPAQEEEVRSGLNKLFRSKIEGYSYNPPGQRMSMPIDDPASVIPNGVAADQTQGKVLEILKLKSAREMLSQLPADSHAKIRNQAASMGLSDEEVKAGDSLVQFGDLEDPKTQNAIKAAILMYQITTGQFGRTPPIHDEGLAPLPVHDTGLAPLQ